MIAPGVWFVLAGRRRPIHLLRAMFGGAVIGGWSQSAPFGEWRDILELFSADRSGSLADMAYVLLSALVLVSMVGGAALALLVELGERAGAAHRRGRSQRPSPPQGATLIQKHADIHRFVRVLLLLRSRSTPRGESSLTLNEILCRARIDWHGIVLNRPDWNDESHSLALTASTIDGRFLVHLIVNAYWEPLAFDLPGAAKSEQGWRRLIDTCLDSPDDICDGPDAPSFRVTAI